MTNKILNNFVIN